MDSEQVQRAKVWGQAIPFSGFFVVMIVLLTIFLVDGTEGATGPTWPIGVMIFVFVAVAWRGLISGSARLDGHRLKVRELHVTRTIPVEDLVEFSKWIGPNGVAGYGRSFFSYTLTSGSRVKVTSMNCPPRSHKIDDIVERFNQALAASRRPSS